jgi:hypothetical protein
MPGRVTVDTWAVFVVLIPLSVLMEAVVLWLVYLLFVAR